MYNACMANNSEILLTDDTKALVGEDVLAFLQKQGVKPDLILSRLDFESDSFWDSVTQNARVSTLMQQIGIAKLVDLDSNGFYGEDFYDDGTTTTSISPAYTLLKNDFEKAAMEKNNAYNSPVSDFSRINKSKLTELGYGSDIIQSRGDHDINVITYPNINSLAEYILRVTKIPENKLSPLIHNLSLKDFNTATLFHETGHTDPKEKDMSSPERELNGDLHANDLYKKAFAQGIVSDPNVLEVRSYIQAISSFTLPLINYTYNGSINPDKNTSHIINSKHSVSLYVFRDNSVNEVYASIGKPLLDIESKFRILSHLDKKSFSPEQVKEYEHLSSLDEAPLEEIEAFMAGIEIPEDQQAKYAFMLRSESVKIGLSIAKDQPELVYEASKMLLESGRFDDDPAVKNLIENFVIGAERIAPEYFQTNGTPYFNYLKATDSDENLTSGLTPPPQQIATNDLSAAHIL